MNLMEHEVMSAPIGAEAAGEQKQTIEKARTKIIDAAPLMDRLRAAIAFGNEKGLPTDELEQVLADIEGMEEYKGDAIECAIKALSEPLQPWEVLAAQAVLPQPEQHIDIDGTLWITVSDIEQVKRVIVDEEKSKFCKQFYQDAQPEPRTGKWLPWEYAMPGKEYKFHKCSVCGVCDEYVDEVPRPNGTIARIERIRNFCPNCGAKMKPKGRR